MHGSGPLLDAALADRMLAMALRGLAARVALSLKPGEQNGQPVSMYVRVPGERPLLCMPFGGPEVRIGYRRRAAPRQ